MKTNHITQQDIADSLKVSRITVSKALRIILTFLPE